MAVPGTLLASAAGAAKVHVVDAAIAVSLTGVGEGGDTWREDELPILISN